MPRPCISGFLLCSRFTVHHRRHNGKTTVLHAGKVLYQPCWYPGTAEEALRTGTAIGYAVTSCLAWCMVVLRANTITCVPILLYCSCFTRKSDALLQVYSPSPD
jgi:hypothetical protein